MPTNVFRKSSSTVRVGISTLLDGSSRIRTLAPLTKTDKRYSLRFSPPESLEIGVYCISGVNRKRSSICDALMRPSRVWTYSAISFT